MVLQAFQTFRSWADAQAVEGLTSEGKKERYVSHSAQSVYWDQTKIQEILQSCNSVACAGDVSDYVCIFSILVYMEAKSVSALHYLDEMMRRSFDDSRLPRLDGFSGHDDIFGDADDLQNFMDTQWKFYPMPAQPFLTNHPAMPTRVFLPNGKAKPMTDRRVHVKQIFPIEKIPRPSDASRATRRVTVSHMKVRSPSSTQHSSAGPTIVVFKTFPPQDERTYRDEYRGYTAMRNAKDSSNILQCLGSFHYITESGDQFSTIMLELADSGTLRDLFSGNKVPYRSEHVHAMWKSLLGGLYGLAVIHNRNSQNGYLCFHQDLKPSNFFLFGSMDRTKPFSYAVKIGDFGSSHAQSANLGVPIEAFPDKGATRTYGPPETYLGDTLDFSVESSVDMWAIGCIIIETAVWITGGSIALDEFRRHRMEETEGLKHKSLGRSDCFHDGTDVLNCVKKGVVDMIEENRRQHDDITLAMVHLALEYILIGKNERFHAQQLIPKIHRVLRGEPPGTQSNKGSATHQLSGLTNTPPHGNSLPTVQHEPGVPDNVPWSSDVTTLMQSPVSEVLASPPVASPFSATELPDTSWPGSPRVAHLNNTEESPSIRPRQVLQEMSETPVASSSFPFVSIRDLEAWANGKSQELLGQNEAKSVLHGRDFIFLIDNSRHTKQYEEEIRLWTTSLAKLIKTIDTDGIDAANTSSPQAGKIIKSKKDMTKFMDQTFERDIVADCMIENALDKILEPLKARWTQREAAPVTPRRSRYSLYGRSQPTQPWRGVTILIFTNGVWNATREGTCNAELPIRSLIDSMRKNGVPRTHVAIQFVRFGSEERGRRRLEFLDDELDQAFDIVDTKPTTASIWDVVIGPLEAGMDNNVTTSSGPSTPNHNLRLTT